MQFQRVSMRFARKISVFVLSIGVASMVFCSISFGQDSGAKPEQDNRVKKANYELAARWTPAKVGKMLFDTAVTPHWLETGDRFWYSFETNSGRISETTFSVYA